MSAAVRALQLPGRHALDSLAQRLSQALQPWCARWCVPLAGASAVQAEAAERLPGDEPFVELLGAGGRVWLRRSDADLQALARVVFGEAVQAQDHVDDAWAQDLLAQAGTQLGEHIAQTLVGELQATQLRHPPAELFALGAGTTRLACPALGIVLLADAGALLHVPPRPRDAAARRARPLVPLLDAARQAALPLAVELGSVELDLARLLELQPGDVLCLPTRLGDPLPVTLAGLPLARASLGQLGRHKAVQLASA